ncbi:heterokaryon incompatibility protein-domain-containing protein [Apiospora hydei]|uniref:Heterokaryon incompatibility protein-domain-containing protein n=1 Tax=Apiospora hydei TaxID=1337664 RepID=A0ABR1UUT7_9PEZI
MDGPSEAGGRGTSPGQHESNSDETLPSPKLDEGIKPDPDNGTSLPINSERDQAAAEDDPEVPKILHMPDNKRFVLLPDGLDSEPFESDDTLIFRECTEREIEVAESSLFMSLSRTAIDEVVDRWHSARPNTGIELIWSEKLAELKAALPQMLYEGLLQFMRNPRRDEETLAARSWRDDPSAHPYEPLRTSPDKNTIRLMILLPSLDKTAPIKSQLVQDTLEPGGQYEALSYVWGAVPGSARIYVDNRPFMATKNLIAALRALRLRDKPRVLWVDAVCINQKDNAEKATQVQLMGQLYSKASNVLVWLGTENDTSAKSFELLGLVSTWYKLWHTDHPREMTPESIWTAFNMFWEAAHNNTYQGGFNVPVDWASEGIPNRSGFYDTLERFFGLDLLNSHIQCIETLWHNPYWRRVWTLQEVVLARSATVFQGSLSMNWEEFTACMEVIVFYSHTMRDSHPAAVTSDLGNFTTTRVGSSRTRRAVQMRPLRVMRALRHGTLAGKSLKLSALLHSTSDRDATDPPG